MPNSPKSRDKADPPDRRNDQDDHEGSKHRPEEFDVQNPAKQVERPTEEPPVRRR
ncbi:hypothetical protein [Frigidibacter oleivorans]|uniref:hypothetical protein n=1 Tax=Frigidibacter oleivorans TaxID=2487129 RepID=UPI0013E0D825|nr:hypothetical protein [Frigidibacter oleivorans]